jgi:transposase InsO family protein
MPVLAAVPASVWHQRLAHASESCLSKLAGPLKISPSEIFKACSHPSCTVCVQGKSTIKPLLLSESRASRPLELLHTDVSGPKNVPNIDGSFYFVTIIDDYSRFAHVDLVANKSDTQACLRQFILNAEAAFSGQGFKVQKIRSDNGGEYSSHSLADFLFDRGIEHNFTVPYKPQQNGRAERLNRTLQDKARCLLIQSRLPHQVWGKAILTATFIYNRLPSSVHGMAPAALWNDVVPDLNPVRVFGCSAHVVIPRERRQARFDLL